MNEDEIREEIKGIEDYIKELEEENPFFYEENKELRDFGYWVWENLESRAHKLRQQLNQE
jgi:hypothetical protein